MTIDEQFNAAVQCHRSGQTAQAADGYRQVLQRQPNHSGALHLLGAVALESGQPAQALTWITQAIRLAPAVPEYYFTLASVHQRLGRPDEAIAALHRALEIKPTYADARLKLAHALARAGRHDDAILAFTRVTRESPQLPEAWVGLGSSLLKLRQLDESIRTLKHALTLRPHHRPALHALAKAHMALGQLDDTIACYDQAVAHNPADSASASLRLFTQIFHPAFAAADLLRECQAWDAAYAQPLLPHPISHANERSPDRRLRVGYLSPNFRGQAQAFFLAPFFAAHDHGQAEVFCYHDSAQTDVITEQIRTHADQWRPVAGLSDQALADAIRSDQIDILIDLSLHMGGGRPLLFARKPAPIQVAWLAYPGTTGLAAMDYRLTDPFVDPPGKTESDYTEQCLRLPQTFACFDATTGESSLPSPNPLPALTNGFITFGCLCHLSKLNPGLLDLWKKVLLSVPNSRLLLLASPGSGRQWITNLLISRGVDTARIEFIDFKPHRDYMQAYHRIDIGLDTLPYNGHTTSLDAIYMGVPLISRIGSRAAGRTGLSLLSNLNLPDLAADSDDRFISIARDLAADLPRLQELRRTLRDRLLESPISNARQFTADVQAAYRVIWTRWLAGESAPG